ncbi:hypothetical protein LCGC14_2889120, partial [marine sediment metagenome]
IKPAAHARAAGPFFTTYNLKIHVDIEERIL